MIWSLSRAGHLALRLNPQGWHREANLTFCDGKFQCVFVCRRKRQDPRTEKLVQSIDDSFASIHVVFPQQVYKNPPDRVRKMSLNCHITMNTHVIVLSALFLLIDVVLHVLIQSATIAPTRPFVQGVFLTLTIRTVVLMLLPHLLNQIACRLK